MKITYEILDTESETAALVAITPETMINGFAGITLHITKNAQDGVNWIEDRVKWKVNQELGMTAQEIQIEKV